MIDIHRNARFLVRQLCLWGLLGLLVASGWVGFPATASALSVHGIDSTEARAINHVAAFKTRVVFSALFADILDYEWTDADVVDLLTAFDWDDDDLEAAAKEEEKAEKQAAKAREKAVKAAEKLAEKEAEAAEKLAEKEAKRLEKVQEAQAKAAEKAEKIKAKAAEAEAKRLEKQANAAELF